MKDMHKKINEIILVIATIGKILFVSSHLNEGAKTKNTLFHVFISTYTLFASRCDNGGGRGEREELLFGSGYVRA